MKRKKVRTGAPWESVVRYCQTIRIGDRIEVAGTKGSSLNELPLT